MKRTHASYELALWGSLGLFVAAIIATAASVWLRWGWAAFGALVVLSLGGAILVLFMKDMHEYSQYGGDRLKPPPDPSRDLFALDPRDTKG